VPKTTRTNGSKPRTKATATRSPKDSGSTDVDSNLDEEVANLRDAGRSYSFVAQTLGLKRARDAHSSFVRVLTGMPAEQRAAMAKREAERLDALEARVRVRDGDDPTTLARRLGAVQKLRQSMLDLPS
jgi:hypothetical protein